MCFHLNIFSVKTYTKIQTFIFQEKYSEKNNNLENNYVNYDRRKHLKRYSN